MKKRITSIIAVIVSVALLAACDPTDGGYQHIDTVRTFESAIISLPNGEVVSGRVDKWKDFEDGDQLQIKIEGTWYLVHSTNCVLMKFED